MLGAAGEILLREFRQFAQMDFHFVPIGEIRVKARDEIVVEIQARLHAD